MQLNRCSDQTRQTLDEFYASMTEPKGAGEAMLSLIQRLRALSNPRKLYGLTSRGNLILLSSDSYQSPWHVKFIALDRRNYFIEYLIPESLAPWPNAYIKGEARSEDEALKMILIAIEKSAGWTDPERKSQ